MRILVVEDDPLLGRGTQAGLEQAGFAAAEKLREELTEMRVHLVEGLLQHVACLAVDLADGVFEGVDR